MIARNRARKRTLTRIRENTPLRLVWLDAGRRAEGAGQRCSGAAPYVSKYLDKRLHVLPYPLGDLRKAEFVPVHGADDKGESVRGFDFDVGAVAPQEDVGGGEGDALVAVEEAVVVGEGLH